MDLYEILKELEIEFSEIEHDPVFTIADMQDLKQRIEGIGCKNLFLTDGKGHYFLVILMDTKKADVKKIGRLVHASHLSFAKEVDLSRILHLDRGSVTSFGIISDEQPMVSIVIDEELKGKMLLFHPNTNRRTISLKYVDLIRFIEYEKHAYLLLK